MTRFLRLSYALIPCIFVLISCAHLHHVEIGEIDNSKGKNVQVEVMASETGINVREASQIANAATTSKSFQRTSNTVSQVWKMITYGPKTGNVTFSDKFADELPQKLLEACPTRILTGIVSMRETNKYPVISGEIVKLTGFCIYPETNGVKKGSL